MEQEVRIFKEIHDEYGKGILQNVRRWEWAVIHEVVTREQLFFLHSCIRNNVFPKSVHYKPPIPTDRAKELAKKLSIQMRKELITDAHHRLEKYEQEVARWKNICVQVIDAKCIGKIDLAIQHTAEAKRTVKRDYLNLKLQRLRNSKKENQENLSDKMESLNLSRNRVILGEIDPLPADDDDKFPSFNAAITLGLHDSGLYDDYYG